MSEEQGKYVKLESFMDSFLAQLIALPMPMTSFCVLGALAGCVVCGFFLAKLL